MDSTCYIISSTVGLYSLGTDVVLRGDGMRSTDGKKS
jgi:hypothetical protein